MSENEIRDTWEGIRPDLQAPDELIALAKAGTLIFLGTTVVIKNELPKFGDASQSDEAIIYINEMR